jgi:hypothetical protein
VYHDRADCPAGRQIKLKHRAVGSGQDRHLCEVCELWDQLDELRTRLAELSKQIKQQIRRLHD